MRQNVKFKLTRARRPIAALFGILAMVLPMLAPVVQGIPLSGASDDGQAPLYLVLCKTMQKGTSGQSPDQDQDPTTADCPVCLGFSFSKLVLFTPLAEPVASETHLLAFVFNFQNESRDGRPVSRAHARGPPLST